MSNLLDEIKLDLHFLKSHTLQPKWFKVLKVFYLTGNVGRVLFSMGIACNDHFQHYIPHFNAGGAFYIPYKNQQIHNELAGFYSWSGRWKAKEKKDRKILLSSCISESNYLFHHKSSVNVKICSFTSVSNIVPPGLQDHSARSTLSLQPRGPSRMYGYKFWLILKQHD